MEAASSGTALRLRSALHWFALLVWPFLGRSRALRRFTRFPASLTAYPRRATHYEKGTILQHILKISRKIEYALRAMIYLASVDPSAVVPFKEIGERMQVPKDFLAKILKTLSDRGLVRSVRGAHGGYTLARPAREVSFLEVIEAVEGQIALNLCLEDQAGDPCGLRESCTMWSVWKEGQDRMLDVYRRATIADLAMSQRPPALVALSAQRAARA